jgi:hypothetical protein
MVEFSGQVVALLQFQLVGPSCVVPISFQLARREVENVILYLAGVLSPCPAIPVEACHAGRASASIVAATVQPAIRCEIADGVELQAMPSPPRWQAEGPLSAVR